MSDFEIISDGQLNELLKAKLLHSKDGDTLTDKLIDLQSRAVFAAPIASAPVLANEAKLLSKVTFPAGIIYKALWLSCITIVGTVVIVVASLGKTAQPSAMKPEFRSFKNIIAPQLKEKVSTNSASGIPPQPAVVSRASLPTAVLVCEEKESESKAPMTDSLVEAKTSDTKTATPSAPLAAIPAVTSGLSPEMPVNKDVNCRLRKSAVTTPLLFTPVEK